MNPSRHLSIPQEWRERRRPPLDEATTKAATAITYYYTALACRRFFKAIIEMDYVFWSEGGRDEAYAARRTRRGIFAAASAAVVAGSCVSQSDARRKSISLSLFPGAQNWFSSSSATAMKNHFQQLKASSFPLLQPTHFSLPRFA